MEQVAYHVHAHLTILLDGRLRPMAPLVGIPGGEVGLPRCYYWLHTHDRSGVVHIESPDQRTYTLGQFFDVWGMPLNLNRVADTDVPDGHLTIFVDGKKYSSDPREIELHNHEEIVLELGQEVPPPPPFDFAKAGL